MGQEIERAVLEAGKHEIVAIHCKQIGEALDAGSLKNADVVIDFTTGELIPEHIAAYCQAGIDAVIGTTGWDTQDAKLQNKIEKAGIGVMVGSNFSSGMQVFLQLIAEASRQLHRIGGYDVYGSEIHHASKKDSPSGTTKTIAQTILDNFPSKTVPRYDRVDGQIGPEELHLASLRGGHHPGYHEIIFDSPADEIHLVHSARGRRGFAEGSILAAENIHGKKGLMFFEELFQPEGPYAA